MSVDSATSTAATLSTLPGSSNTQRKKAMRKEAALKFNQMKERFGPVLWILKLKSEDMKEAAKAAKQFTSFGLPVVALLP